jgi:hypothetical protein
MKLGPEGHGMSPRTRPWASDGGFSVSMGQRERRVGVVGMQKISNAFVRVLGRKMRQI